MNETGLTVHSSRWNGRVKRSTMKLFVASGILDKRKIIISSSCWISSLSLSASCAFNDAITCSNWWLYSDSSAVSIDTIALLILCLDLETPRREEGILLWVDFHMPFRLLFLFSSDAFATVGIEEVSLALPAVGVRLFPDCLKMVRNGWFRISKALPFVKATTRE